MSMVRKRAGNSRRGAMLVLVAITLVIFIVALVFSIDVAYMQLVRSQLRAAADAAAKAGAQMLSTEQNEQAAIQKAIDVAAENIVAGEAFQLAAEDVEVGKSVVQADGSWDFIPNGTPYSAVRVNAERSAATASGPVRLLVGGILGQSTFAPRQVATASQVDQDVVLVMDRSGSMAWDESGTEWSYPSGGDQCAPPHATLSRWSSAAKAVNAFLDAVAQTRPVEHVSIVSFSSTSSSCGRSVQSATIDSGLSVNYSQARTAITQLSSQSIIGGTNVAAGIDKAVEVLTGAGVRPFAQKTIIVMTDGQWNEGRSPVLAARDAAARGIKIHSITFSENADETSMRSVASEAGGKHFHAPNGTALQQIYEEIAFTLHIILTE
jgi:Flp pilus assembly protein TadG